MRRFFAIRDARLSNFKPCRARHYDSLADEARRPEDSTFSGGRKPDARKVPLWELHAQHTPNPADGQAAETCPQRGATLMGTRHSRPRPDRLADKLLSIRKTFGYTLEEMAQALAGVKKSPPSKAHVLRYETGEREPSLFYLMEVCDVFGVDLRDLVDDRRDITLPKKARKR